MPLAGRRRCHDEAGNLLGSEVRHENVAIRYPEREVRALDTAGSDDTDEHVEVRAVRVDGDGEVARPARDHEFFVGVLAALEPRLESLLPFRLPPPPREPTQVGEQSPLEAATFDEQNVQWRLLIGGLADDLQQQVQLFELVLREHEDWRPQRHLVERAVDRAEAHFGHVVAAEGPEVVDVLLCPLGVCGDQRLEEQRRVQSKGETRRAEQREEQRRKTSREKSRGAKARSRN